MASSNGGAGLTNKSMNPTAWTVRQALICISAASVGLPVAWISLAKVLVVLFGLTYLSSKLWSGKSDTALSGSLTAKTILFALFALFASLIWTKTSMDIALLALVKHAKILVILLLILIIRTKEEARLGLIAFATAQTFVLLSSLLLFGGVSIPWVTEPIGKYVVFSSYLDQSIMLSSTAAVLWHLRAERYWPVWFAAMAGTTALANALLMLQGRTGYAVGIAMIAMATMWAMPRRFQFATLVLTPVLVLGVLYFGFSHIQNRIAAVFSESSHFSRQVETDSSSGWRLNAWQRSIQGIEQSPLYGHGVGSWTITVKRIEGESAVKVFGEGNASNPHQEFLLWGVELGILGSLLFAGILLAMALDALRFRPPVQKAVWSVLAALAVASLFNSALYDDLIGDFFCVTLGLLMALGLRDTPSCDKALT